MNDKTKQALELASEELQFFHIAGLARLQTLEAIAAIREALAEQPHCDDCGGFDPECPLAQPAQQEPVAWEGGEGWESLAWELCAEENGEEACNELIWEGGPIPEPWGDRWMKYEDEAKRLIALVQKHTSPPASKPWVGLADEDKQIAFDDTQEGGGFWEFADAIEAKLREKNA